MSIAISARIQEPIFRETEDLLPSLNISRNTYVNKALEAANKYYKKQYILKKIKEESRKSQEDSHKILQEFEAIE
jgi:hypothetical protein